MRPCPLGEKNTAEKPIGSAAGSGGGRMALQIQLDAPHTEKHADTMPTYASHVRHSNLLTSSVALKQNALRGTRTCDGHRRANNAPLSCSFAFLLFRQT